MSALYKKKCLNASGCSYLVVTLEWLVAKVTCVQRPTIGLLNKLGTEIFLKVYISKNKRQQELHICNSYFLKSEMLR